jgi:hypothetical protein
MYAYVYILYSSCVCVGGWWVDVLVRERERVDVCECECA